MVPFRYHVGQQWYVFHADGSSICNWWPEPLFNEWAPQDDADSWQVRNEHSILMLPQSWEALALPRYPPMLSLLLVSFCRFRYHIHSVTSQIASEYNDDLAVPKANLSSTKRGETVIAGFACHLLGYIFNRIFTEIPNRGGESLILQIKWSPLVVGSCLGVHFLVHLQFDPWHETLSDCKWAISICLVLCLTDPSSLFRCDLDTDIWNIQPSSQHYMAFIDLWRFRRTSFGYGTVRSLSIYVNNC